MADKIITCLRLLNNFIVRDGKIIALKMSKFLKITQYRDVKYLNSTNTYVKLIQLGYSFM